MYDPGGWIDDVEVEPEDPGGNLLSVGTVDYMTLREAEGLSELPTTEEGWRQREWLRRTKIYDARMATAAAAADAVTPSKALDELSKPMHFRKAQCFPTKRRPVERAMSTVGDDVIDGWFQTCGVRVFEGLSAEETRKARRLLYTWRDVFESDMLKIKRTDLIEHCVELTPNARPVKSKIPLYTEKERAFCNTLLPQMEQAGLIYRCDSKWGARTKFPPKPNAPEHLRMVHNYIPLNRCSRKSQYPTPRIEQIVQTIMKAGKKIFFCTDAANSYWAIPLRRKDWLLTSFVTPSGQFCYGVMGQGLTGGTHTYSRYRDIVFGYIPEDVDANGNEIPGFPSVIGDSADGSVAFDGMVDDSYGSATDFDSMFTFLHEKFFPRCAFGPMYLKPSKSFFFFPTLEFLGLEGNTAGLRPSLRKREQILGWPTPQSQEEVEAFLYLTPFLRRFIPGRAEHHRIMTGDKKGPFVWTAEKEQSFLAVKQAIAENAMASVDLKLQYHLAVDASKRATGGVLFQLHDVPAGTQAGPEHRAFERIIMFMSFRISDAESRYSNSEREALAVIRNLAEVRWLVTASPHPTMVYTDHEALKTLLVGVDNDAHGRIANWQDRLGEYNVQLFHKSSKIHFMGIADGLSRLPTRLLGQHVMEDSDRPDPVLSVASATILAAPCTAEAANRRRNGPLQGTSAKPTEALQRHIVHRHGIAI
jgi:hypothetical protein